MTMLLPAPLCVASADEVIRRHLGEVLAGQGQPVAQTDSLAGIVELAHARVAAAIVDPRLPGLGADPMARLRAAPALHRCPILMLRDAELDALRGTRPAAALITLMLRVHAQVNGDAQLDLLQEVSGALTAAPDIDSTVANILRAITDRVTTDTATMFLLEEDGGLVARAAWGYDLDTAQLRRLDRTEGVVGWVVSERAGTIVGDSDLDERFKGAGDRAKRSMLAVPILIGHRTLGAITLVRRAPAAPFTDADLVLVGTIGTSAGTALESARIYEAERAVRARLEQAEDMVRQERDFLAKLEAYDRLYTQVVSTVSHELKTPLMGIRGFAQLIRDGGITPADVVDFASEIHDNAVRLSRYVEGILDEDAVHSGRVSLDLRPVLLRPLVHQVLRTLRAAAGATHTLVEDVAEAVPPVAADPDKLAQILMNLVGNAIKYSPDGGQIAVRARAVRGRVAIAVEDQGLGIPEAARARVFDRFYRVPGGQARGIGGTGLGLSIVRGLVELHGGTIAVETGPGGRGSRFVIDLPSAAPSVARPGDGTGRLRPRPSPHTRVARLADASREAISERVGSDSASVAEVS